MSLEMPEFNEYDFPIDLFMHDGMDKINSIKELGKMRKELLVSLSETQKDLIRCPDDNLKKRQELEKNITDKLQMIKQYDDGIQNTKDEILSMDKNIGDEVDDMIYRTLLDQLGRVLAFVSDCHHVEG